MCRDVGFSKSLYLSIILERYRLAFMYLPTLERAHTLSAERITFRASSPAATLGERMSKC